MIQEAICRFVAKRFETRQSLPGCKQPSCLVHKKLRIGCGAVERTEEEGKKLIYILSYGLFSYRGSVIKPWTYLRSLRAIKTLMNRSGGAAYRYRYCFYSSALRIRRTARGLVICAGVHRTKKKGGWMRDIGVLWEPIYALRKRAGELFRAGNRCYEWPTKIRFRSDRVAFKVGQDRRTNFPRTLFHFLQRRSPRSLSCTDFN